MNPNLKKLLKKLESTRHIYWNISRETAIFLHQLILDQNIKTALEIGTSTGYSGIWLAQALKQNKGHLYTIESHKKERFKLGADNFEKSGLKNITHILGHAPEDIPKTPRKFDLAFLDATKFQQLDSFLVLQNRIRKGGFLISDNVVSHQKELSPFLKAIKKDKSFHTITLNLGTGLLIAQKIA